MLFWSGALFKAAFVYSEGLQFYLFYFLLLGGFPKFLFLNLHLLRTAEGDVPGELPGGRPGEGGPAADVASSARAAAGGRTRRGDGGGRGQQ